MTTHPPETRLTQATRGFVLFMENLRTQAGLTLEEELVMVMNYLHARGSRPLPKGLTRVNGEIVAKIKESQP